MNIKQLLMILLSVGLFGSSMLYAQGLSREEKKALKAEAKKMQKNPELYLKLKEDISDKEAKLQELSQEENSVKQEIADKQAILTEKDSIIKALGDEIVRAKQKRKEVKQAVDSQTNIEGVVYKVQVEIDESALYQKVRMEGNEIKKEIIFSGEEDADGARKYTLGYFKDQSEAETFTNYLRLLRVKEAKTVKYDNNKKVE